MSTPSCLCCTPGIVLSAPCPVCTAPVAWEAARATLKPARASRASAPRTPSALPQLRPSAPLAPPPVRKDGAPPQVVGPDEQTDPGLPDWAVPSAPTPPAPTDGASLMAAILESPAPTTPAPARGRDVLERNLRPVPMATATPEPLRVVPAPPSTPIPTAWGAISADQRAGLLTKIRASFTAGDTMLGILQVCVLANRAEFQARKAELQELDVRANLTGLTVQDDTRRWQIFDSAVRELGFDPRQSDGATPAQSDGAALLAEILGG